MRLPHPIRRRELGDVLPLINIVFLLLIFFMLVGALEPADPFELTPPESASDEAAGARELLVFIAADGRLALDHELVDLEGLPEAAAERLEERPGAAVKIKADGQAESTRLIEVMEALHRAGVARVTLLASPR